MDLRSLAESPARSAPRRRGSRLARPHRACGAPSRARRAICAAMMNLPAEHYFTKEAAQEWTRIAEKHRLRDEQFLRVVARWFRPGSILEIGAATGHLSAILYRRGCDVLASDYSPALGEAIKARGVPAAIVDATKDIRTQTNRTF